MSTDANEFAQAAAASVHISPEQVAQTAKEYPGLSTVESHVAFVIDRNTSRDGKVDKVTAIEQLEILSLIAKDKDNIEGIKSTIDNLQDATDVISDTSTFVKTSFNAAGLTAPSSGIADVQVSLSRDAQELDNS